MAPFRPVRRDDGPASSTPAQRAMSRRNPAAAACVAAFALLLAIAAACGDETTVAPDDAGGGETPVATRAGESGAGTYYVSNRGDDEADGAQVSTAFRTIGRALEVVRPGDTVLIQPGTYHEALTLEEVGGPAMTITIRGDGGTPALDGRNDMSIAFWCEPCTNITFENLEINNYTDIGIGVSLSSDITMRDLNVHDNGTSPQLVDWEIEGYGIQAEESTGVTIENNEVYRNGPRPISPGRLGTGIDTFELTDSVIRGNRSHDNIGGGILVEDGVRVVVEGNEVTSNYLDASADEWWDGGLWLDGGRDVTVRDNVFKDNQGPGIEISDEEHARPSGYVLEGNTITGNYFGIYLWNFGTSDLPDEDILRMSNNRISGNARQQLWIVPWECPPPYPCDE